MKCARNFTLWAVCNLFTCVLQSLLHKSTILQWFLQLGHFSWPRHDTTIIIGMWSEILCSAISILPTLSMSSSFFLSFTPRVLCLVYFLECFILQICHTNNDWSTALICHCVLVMSLSHMPTGLCKGIFLMLYIKEKRRIYSFKFIVRVKFKFLTCLTGNTNFINESVFLTLFLNSSQ